MLARKRTNTSREVRTRKEASHEPVDLFASCFPGDQVLGGAAGSTFFGGGTGGVVAVLTLKTEVFRLWNTD